MVNYLYAAADDKTCFYQRDGLGSVTEIMDDQGEVIERCRYSPYGKLGIYDSSWNELSGSSIGNPYFFTGREYDPESGLYYYRARMYSPVLGRFLHPDPVMYLDGFNLYRYCANNPANFIDPDGRAYFASRPLRGFPWIPGASHNPLDDFFNTELSHEQLFFEDAQGGNIGFFGDGTLKEELNPSGYRKTRTGFDDALMREAFKNIPLQPFHLLWQPSRSKEKFNCQDWGEAVRREYERLRKEREKKDCNN